MPQTAGLFIQRLLARPRHQAQELGRHCGERQAPKFIYTGLRVGAATVKGLCYAWKKPLIAVSTLQMMASRLQAE